MKFPWPLTSSLTPINRTASSKRQPAMQSCAATCQTSPSHPSNKVGQIYWLCVCVLESRNSKCLFWLHLLSVFTDSSCSHLQLWRKPVIGLLPTMTRPGSETSAKQVGTKSVDPWAVLLEEVMAESSVTPACTLSGLNWISRFELVCNTMLYCWCRLVSL